METSIELTWSGLAASISALRDARIMETGNVEHWDSEDTAGKIFVLCLIVRERHEMWTKETTFVGPRRRLGMTR